MTKPTVLIVGGAWHTAEYLKPLAKVFDEAGYPSRCVGLPSAGANPPATDFLGDVATIRNAVTEITAKNKDVVAVLHSLGGIPDTEALHGLGKRAADGGAGIIAIVYIASMIPQKGNGFEEHLLALGDDTWRPARDAFTQEGMLTLPPDFASHMFYNDLEESQAKHWASLLQPQSAGVYDSKITHETYREIPSGYLLTTRDQAFKYDYQVETVEMAGIPKDKTETFETGHTPWLTKPEEVKQFILRIVDAAQ